MTRNDTERGTKWWLRYVIVPLIGSGGLVAVVVALINRPQPVPVGDTRSAGLDDVAAGSSAVVTTDESATEPGSVRVLLDLSQRQDRWIGMASAIHAARPGVIETNQQITEALLTEQGPSVLIVPLPFHEPVPERKIDLLETWVRQGGGLFFLAHYAGDIHHGSNPSTVTERWGVVLRQTYLLPDSVDACEARRGDNVERFPPLRSLVQLEPAFGTGHPALSNVKDVAVGASPALRLIDGFPTPVTGLKATAGSNICVANPLPDSCSPDGLACNIRWTRSGAGDPTVLVAFQGRAAGAGRVVIAGTWKIFHAHGDNHRLVNQLIDWLAGDR